MKEIKRIQIFTNKQEKSEKIKIELENILKENNYELVNDSPDLSIAIGGDGSFLKMVNKSKFNSDTYYIGINTGSLGFLQEIKPNELELFVNNLKNNSYKIDEIGVLETVVKTKNDTKVYHSLNEMVIRDAELNVFIADIYVDDCKLETLAGDGVLISTSIGSSAYNVSFHGSLVYDTLHTLQITPIAPITTKLYRNLRSSLIIPDNKKIKIIPKNENVLTIRDGDNTKEEKIIEIECTIKDRSLKFLRMKKYNYINIINEKFISVE